MDLRVFTEPQQGATYDDLLAVARAAEDLGFGGFFRSDHYLHMSGDGGPGPTDAWTTLAGLARDTSTIRLGTLVTSATFRLPGPLSVQVAGVDQMSGGRVELGLGAGWFEQEHTAYGIPFPALGDRFDRLEEQLAVITGLWETPVGQTFSHNGAHYPIADSPALTKPVQEGGVPLIIGGAGKRRTPALAAQYAAEFNAAFQPASASGELFRRVRAACAERGRDGDDLVYSAAQVVVLGDDAATLKRRADAIGREVDELRANGLAGSADEIVDRIGAFAEVGASRIYLQVLDLADLDHLEDIAHRVAPQL
ncbi:LLM class F420-dependent oxidoreductase [Intrasporangium calvum]|uniref:LLM class F420-dependent oxidoreductase n=1 Tax=Intrasporangium calvum TaxID=53358 RepID=A0ABT5GDE7_9MICO|nr:LLM class F420-dependent oxidoreductase [Intrasporangium calvum]MDC5696263.1 LLM class F420-dependent oxidoreductase [Intrasporangium calvum]